MILLVEDDPVTAEMLSQLFRRLRYPARRVGTLAEATALLRGVAVDLIVLDVELPDGNGIALVEDLRPLPWLRDVPVVFCAGDSSADIIERVLRLGVTDFIRKPIPVDKMAMRLDRVMERRPRRIPSPRDLLVKHRVDSRRYVQLRDDARQALGALADALDAVLPVDHGQLTALVAAAAGASVAFDALRTAAILEELGPGRPPFDAQLLREAVKVEISAFDGTMEISEPKAARLSGAWPAL
ncbi:MAG: response regulator [Gemmatimonadetes bacterium]|nr:response regulator [Gemmatimonadota bacterium]MBI3568288.1 response regulator [Gemmatimonadota bacterium]